MMAGGGCGVVFGDELCEGYESCSELFDYGVGYD